MKKIIKKYILVSFLILFFSFVSEIYASSINLNVKSNLLVGESVVVTINGEDVTGKFFINVDTDIISVNKNSIFIDNGKVDLPNGENITIKANHVGKAVLTLSPAEGNVSNNLGEDISSSIQSKSIDINVEENVTSSTQPNTSTNFTSTTNETNSNASNDTSNNNVNNEIKDTNANLKRLVPRKEGLTPNFNQNITKYNIIIPSTLNDLEFLIETESSNAKYEIEGNTNLKNGDNIVIVKVTAADNITKKSYKITVTKAENVEKANALLSNIIIDDMVLNPEFSSENLEYDIGETTLDKISVHAYPQIDRAKIEITGNESLKIGENIIKIKIIAEDGVTTKEYSLKVIKKTNINSIKKEEKSFGIWLEYFKKNYINILLLTISIVELVQIIYLYRKTNDRKKK